MNREPSSSEIMDGLRLEIARYLVAIWRDGGELGAHDFLDYTPGQRAWALGLVRHALRVHQPVSRWLSARIPRAPKPMVRALLHLGMAEILLGKTRPDIVVSSIVNIAKSQALYRHAAPLLNRLLRDALREDFTATAPYLSQKIREKLREDYDQETVEAIDLALGATPPLDLCPKNLNEAQTLAQRIEGRFLENYGVIRLDQMPQVTQIPGYETGEWWVQDAAATLPVRILAPKIGARVLDLCAAPGGKTMQLAAMGCAVTAVDISKHKIERLRENLARTKLAARVIQADARSFTDAPFDAILLDAPCSASGTLRRHPELPFNYLLERMLDLLPLQADILENAAHLLGAGGEMVYATCSLFKEEGEMQIESFLNQHPEFCLCPLDDIDPKNGPFLRTLPNQDHPLGGMDGFFIAKLKKYDKKP